MRYLFTVKLDLIQNSRLLNDAIYEIVSKLRKQEVKELEFHINTNEYFKITCDLFGSNDEFVNACFRLILTMKIVSITAL